MLDLSCIICDGSIWYCFILFTGMIWSTVSTSGTLGLSGISRFWVSVRGWFKSEKSFIRFCQIIFHCLTFNMNDISLIAMDCVAILGIASWFILIGHNQYGKLSKAELITLCWWPKCCWLFCHQHRCWLFKSQLVIGGLAEILTQRSFIWDFTCYWY